MSIAHVIKRYTNVLLTTLLTYYKQSARHTLSRFIMAACNRAGHYIFVLWFLLLFSSFYLFSSPILSRRRLDIYRTSTHDVALVRI